MSAGIMAVWSASLHSWSSERLCTTFGRWTVSEESCMRPFGIGVHGAICNISLMDCEGMFVCWKN